MNKYTLKDIAEIGVFVGLALILNLPVFKIHISSDAGSISFVLIPLFIIAIRHSWWKTFVACAFVFALPACLMGGHGLITYPLDYMCGFGILSIISLFRYLILSNRKSSYFYLILSSLIAVFLRFIFSSISSVVIYEYNWILAFSYNSVYIFASGLIAIIALLILLKPLKILNSKFVNNDAIHYLK